MLLARLFNAVVSKLLVNEYKQIAEHYGHQYRFVMQELNSITTHHMETEGELRRLRTENKRLAEALEHRFNDTVRAPDSEKYESAAMLVNAAIINNEAKETIAKLQQQVYTLQAKIKECERSSSLKRNLLDNVSTQLKEVQQENYDLKQTILSLEEACRRLERA